MSSINRRFMLIGGVCIACFYVLYVLPLLLSAFYTFVKSPQNWTFVGLSHYGEVLQNAYFQLGLKNSAVFALLCVLITMGLSLPLAYLMERCKLQWVLVPLVLPLFLPGATAALIAKQLFDPIQGILTGPIPASVTPMLGLVVLYVWKYLGLFSLLIFTGMRAISPTITEAALIDGASPLMAYMRISLKLLRPQLLFTLVLATAYAFRSYREAFMLFGAYPTDSVYFLTHYMQNNFSKINFAKLSVGAMMLVLPVFLIMAVVLRFDKRFREDAV